MHPGGITEQLLLSPQTQVHPVLTGFQQVRPDWRIHLRVLPEYLLYVLLKGGIRGILGNDRRHFRLRAPAVLWLAPGTSHAFSPAPEMLPIVLYHFRFRCTHPELPVSGADGFIMAHELPQTEHLARRYYDAAQQPFSSERGHVLRCLLFLIYRDVITASANVFGEPETFFRKGKRLPAKGTKLSWNQRHLLFEYVRRNIHHRLTPAQLADEVCLSPDYFSRVFRRTFGISPRSWLTRQRIEYAAHELLQSPDSVSQIAERFGFQDLYLFSRQFKQIMGISPSNWRKREFGSS